MADVIRRVVTQMGLESSDYQRAADGVAQANEKMVVSGQKVVDTTAQIEQRQVTSSRTIDKLEATIDKNVRAYQTYQRQLELVQRAYDDGNISITRALELTDKVEVNYQRVTGTIKEATTAYQTLNGAVNVSTKTLREYAEQALAARQAQAAENNQANFNSYIGVGAGSGKSAQESAQVFEEVAQAEAAASAEQDRLTLAAQKYRDQINPILPLHRQYAADLRELNELTKAGYLTDSQRAAAAKSLTDSFNQQTGAMKGIAGQSDIVTRGWGLSRTGMMEMQAAGVNAFQALASGMSPWRVAQMESAQVLGALVQGTQGFLKFVLNPWVLGFAAAATAVGLLIHAVSSAHEELMQFQTVINASSDPLALSTGHVKTFVTELRNAGVSAADAREAIIGAIRDVAGASASDLERATKDAADFSAAYGVPIKDAEKSLVDMGANGYSAIMKLDAAHHFLSASQALMISQLAEQGKQSQAVEVAFEALENRIKDAAENSMTPMTKATNDLSSAWSDLMSRIGNSQAAIGIVQGLADAMSNPVLWNNLPFGLSSLFGQSSADRWNENAKQLGLGTSGGAHGAIVSRESIASQASQGNPEAQKWIDEQTLAYDRQNQVLQASVGIRAAVQAGLEAEHQAMLHGAGPTQMATAYSDAYNAAMKKQAAAANDNVRAIELQTADTLKVAAAYGQGTDAVIAAQAAMQVDANVTAIAAGYKNKLTQELIKQKEAELQLQAAQELANSKLKTAADIEALRISQITDPQVRHDEELKAQRQQHLNELTLKYGDNIAKVNDLMGQFDKQQALEDQTRYWNEVASTAKSYSDDITGYIVDGLTGVGNSGKSMWASMWDTAMAGAKRFLVKLAATFLENTLIIPIVTQIVGSNSSLLGIVSAGGSTGSSLGGLGSLLSGGSSGILGTLSSAYNLLNTGGSSLLSGLGSDLIYSSLGQSLGLSTSVVNMSHLATAGGLQMTGAGSLLSSGLGLLGAGGTGFGIGSIISSLGIGNSTGSSIGGALGGAIGSIIPGVGTIIGSVAGSLLGGLFGNSQPSDMFANTGIDLTKGTIGSVEHGRADETSSTNNSASQNLANSFLTVEKQLVALTGGTAPSSAFAKVGSRDGIVVGVGDGATFWNNLGSRKTFANTEEGAQQAIDWMVQTLAKQLTGITNADIQKVLDKGGTSDEIISNLTLVQSILTATATAADPLVTALKTINDSFDALKTQATDLGLSTDLLTKLEAARQAQLDETNAAYSLGGYSNVASSLSTITNFLSGQQLSDVSSLSPLGKQSLAQQQFNDLLAKVQGGDLTQTSNLTSAASNYLSIARTNYGSTAGFSSVESYVTQSLAALGESISSQQSIADQITKAMQLASQSNVEKLDELKQSISSELAQLRQAFQLLAQQIAA